MSNSEPRFVYVFHEEDPDGHVHMFDSEDFHLDHAHFRCVREWCWVNFGDAGFAEKNRWASTGKGDTIWIRHDDDAVAFRLRWC